MRTLVSLGLLALSLGSFTNIAFAGNVEDCESLKQTGQKSLYGLCVAWHNADEAAKDGLAAKFFDRAGFPVPGSEDPEPEPDFTCPCWSEVTFADICALGAPVFSEINTVYGDVGFIDTIAFTIEGFGGDTGELACAHTIQDLTTGNFLLDNTEADLTEDEALDCLAEVSVIGTMYLGGGCN